MTNNNMTTMTKIRLDSLLSLNRSDFLQYIGGIYENTPIIVTQFYNENLNPALISAADVSNTKIRITNVKRLFDEIRRYVEDRLSIEERLQLLRAHPDLCAALLKKKKQDEEASKTNDNQPAEQYQQQHEHQRLTDESRLEQRRSGLSSLTPEELQNFNTLNEQYKSKFNIPFILAVRNASKYTVLAAIQSRVNSNYETEIATALHQVHNIAWMRLLAIVDPPLVVRDGVLVDVGHGGFLTCHILDTAHGLPAIGMHVELYRLEDGTTNDSHSMNNQEEGSFTTTTTTTTTTTARRYYNRKLLSSFLSNTDGRSGAPLLSGPEFVLGRYELLFYVGDYFASRGSQLAGTPFLDVVPIQFGIDDPTSHYHVPLLASPWSYSTYRGS